jgi:hypothetical protein
MVDYSVRMTQSTDPFGPMPPPVLAQPAADLRAVPTEQDLTLTRTFPIRWPPEDLDDFQVGVRASVLAHCRSSLADIASDRFPWSEVLLGIASLSLGASASGWISGLPLSSIKGVIFFVVTPILGTGAGVAYFMLRKFWTDDARRVARSVLKELPDPDHTVSSGSGR